jgi:hypothetical protein
MNAKRRQLQRKQRELDLEQSSSHASSFSSLNNNNNNNNNNQSNFTNTSKHFKSRLMNNQNKQQQQQQLQQQTSSSHYDIPIPQNNPTSPSIHLFKATNTSPNNQYSNPLSIATSPNYISIPLASQLHTDKHSTQHHNYNNHHQRNFPQTKVHEPQFLIKNAQRAPNAASSVVSILKQQQQQPLTTVNDLPPHKPTESERIEQLNKMIKIFKLGNNINADNILVGDNNIYAHNKKEIAELQSRIENEEMKLHNLMISNKNVTQEYIERIIQLQNDIMNSPKGDIISLEEANKVDDVVIKNLLYKKKKVKEEYEMERNELKKMISERIKPMINELKKEIKEVQELKRQLKECKEKELPKDMKNKLEVVIHYKTEN